jgi:hypothetical protein
VSTFATLSAISGRKSQRGFAPDSRWQREYRSLYGGKDLRDDPGTLAAYRKRSRQL